MLVNFVHYVIVYTFYDLETFEICGANCHGLVMNEIYKKIAMYLI